MRIGYAVGANQTVVVEVIVRSVVFVEVAAIAVDAYSVFVFPVAGLVYEVPDKSALIFRIFALNPPSELPRACAYSHWINGFWILPSLYLIHAS